MERTLFCWHIESKGIASWASVSFPQNLQAKSIERTAFEPIAFSLSKSQLVHTNPLSTNQPVVDKIQDQSRYTVNSQVHVKW